MLINKIKLNTYDKNWLKNYNLAVQYCQQNNCNRVPSRYEIDNIQLGRWYTNQIYFYNKGKLLPERIELLKNAGLSLIQSQEELWLYKYNLLKEYYSITEQRSVHNELIYKGENIGAWVSDQRSYYNNNTLSQERINLLKEIDFPFYETTYDTIWMEKFNAVKKFFQETGGNYIPRHAKQDNYDIWVWGRKQRTEYNNNTLSKERINLLKSINFSFKEQKQQGSSIPEAVIFYYIKQVFPNASQRDKTNGFELDIFFECNGKKYGIEYDGEYHHKEKYEDDLNKIKECKLKNIKLYNIRFKNCGSLQENNNFYKEYLFPKEYKFFYESTAFKNTIKEILNEICNELNITNTADINFKRDISNIIKELAKSFNQDWFNNYNIVRELYEEFGEIPDSRYGANSQYYYWVRNRITDYRNNKLSDQQIKLMEDLIPYGFSWTKDRNEKWYKMYDLLLEYEKEFGTTDIKDKVLYKDEKLGQWVGKQRSLNRTGKLKPERYNLLNKIETFQWESSYHKK